jgi:hypothetical protein
MATLTRSSPRRDKNGNLIRIYVVVAVNYWDMRKLAAAIDSAGFKEYRRPRKLYERRNGPAITAVWVVPATKLCDRLIHDAYRAKVNGVRRIDYLQDYKKEFVQHLEDMERGMLPIRHEFKPRRAIG